MANFIEMVIYFFSGVPAWSFVGGGENTDMRRHPWQVAFGDGRFVCGGTLISRKHVLTAAHCFARTPDDLPRVIARGHEWGEYRVWGGGKTGSQRDQEFLSGIQTVIFHNWGDSIFGSKNDLAIIVLSHEVESSEFIQPIALASSGYSKSPSAVKEGLEISGWGGRATILRSAKVSVVNAYSEQMMLEVGGSGQTSLVERGDSGGPLVVRSSPPILLGVASHSGDGGTAFYTDVSLQLQFILRAMK